MKWSSPVEILVGPAKGFFIQINKGLIHDIATGCRPCLKNDDGLCVDAQADESSAYGYSNTTTVCDQGGLYCDVTKKVQDQIFHFCITEEEWLQRYHRDEVLVSGGIAAYFGDTLGSLLVLMIALMFICFALYGIVKLLHYLVLATGRENSDSGEDSAFVKRTQKVLGMHPLLSIIYGALLTVLVQSSSIVTSTLTPLVALGIITLEQMLPLTLGANIGTTCTAFIAAIVSGSAHGIQVSICHFLFNVVGILIWFPHPRMREVPLAWATLLGEHVQKYPWFGLVYIGAAFVVFPSLLFVFSFLISLGIVGIICNIILDGLLVVFLFAFIRYFDTVFEIFEACWAQVNESCLSKCRNSSIAAKLPLSFSLRRNRREGEERASG